MNLDSRDLGYFVRFTNIFVIARRIVDSPKQSTNETFETKANRLLWANLNVNNLLIQF
ncbi:hypothetical protein ACWIUD_05935 [Helicobacter sp. 23-1044]